MKQTSLAMLVLAATLGSAAMAQNNQTPAPTPGQSANSARNILKNQQPSASGAQDLESSGASTGTGAAGGSGGNPATSTVPNPARDKPDVSGSTDPGGTAGVRALSGSSGNPNAGGKSR